MGSAAGAAAEVAPRRPHRARHRLSDRGLLVAAGPLPDESGAGMTIVRVRREHGDVDVTALATVDDLCVAHGYLQVTVPPWQVIVTG
jgi:uncharacterized protein YciI